VQRTLQLVVLHVVVQIAPPKRGYKFGPFGFSRFRLHFDLRLHLGFRFSVAASVPDHERNGVKRVINLLEVSTPSITFHNIVVG